MVKIINNYDIVTLDRCFFFREDEFDVEELSDLLSRVIEISKEVMMVANKAAEACPNRLPKQVLFGKQSTTINHISDTIA